MSGTDVAPMRLPETCFFETVHGFFATEDIHAGSGSTHPSARLDGSGASVSCVRGAKTQFQARCPPGPKGLPSARTQVQKAAHRTTMALACVGIDGCFGDDVNGDETRGPETTIQAPAGTLGISFGSDDTSNVIIAVRPTSPLAGSVAVGDKLVSISGPGRAPFRCGGSTGSEVVGELRAAENTGDRVLTFKKPAAFEVSAPPGALGLIFESHGPRVTALRSWSPLSGRVAVGDVLTSINGEPVAAGDGFDAAALVKGADDGSADRRLAFYG